MSDVFLGRRREERTRLWIVNVGDMTHVKIVESSDNEERDMIAVGFATNHHCSSRRSEHCDIEGGAMPIQID